MALSNDFVQITQAFDPEATRTLGQAFDMACALLGHTHRPESTIEAAKAGERDPVRLREAGLTALSNGNRLLLPQSVTESDE